MVVTNDHGTRVRTRVLTVLYVHTMVVHVYVLEY
jgi:hypothetical protein